MISNFDLNYLKEEVKAGRLRPEDITRQIEQEQGYAISGADEKQLNQLIDSLKEFGKTPDKVDVGTNFQAMAEDIYNKTVERYGIGGENHLDEAGTRAASEAWAHQLVDGEQDPQWYVNYLVERAGLNRNPNILKDALGFAGGLHNSIRDKLSQSGYSQETRTPDQLYDPQLKKLQDALAPIVDTRQRQEALDTTIKSLPNELARGTDSLIQNEYDNAGRTLQDELAPQIAQNLNVRGLLFGGDLGAELTSAGGNLYGGVQDLHAQLLADDDAFFRDAAFKNELQKVSQTDQNYLEGLSRERNTAMQASQDRFKSGQADLQRKFQEDLTKRQAQSSYFQAQEKAEKQRQKERDDAEQAMYQQLGSSFTGIVTAGITSANKNKSNSGSSQKGVTTG